MATFTWTPDQGVTKSSKANVNKSSFGDGYSQRSAEGINSIGEKLALKFTVRTQSEILAIEAFLETQKGVTSFFYTPPGASSSRKYTCDAWDATYMHNGDAELSCTFTREFEP